MLESVQQEHKEKVGSLVRELQQVSLQQTKQLKVIEDIRTETRSSRERRERELTERHEREMSAAEVSWGEKVKSCQAELALAGSETERKMREIRERHRAELEALRVSLEEEKGASESRRWEEREGALRQEMRVREEDLAKRASGLSEELRTVRDQLMLARQRVVEVTEEMETSRGEVCSLRGQLEERQTETERLGQQLDLLQARAESAEEDTEKLVKTLSERDGETCKFVFQLTVHSPHRAGSQTGGRTQTDSGRAPLSTGGSAGETQRTGEREGGPGHPTPVLTAGTDSLPLLHREGQTPHYILVRSTPPPHRSC